MVVSGWLWRDEQKIRSNLSRGRYRVLLALSMKKMAIQQ
jgi:hypothetical protein